MCMTPSIMWCGRPNIASGFFREPSATESENCFKRLQRIMGLNSAELEVDTNHVHLFLSFPPRYAIAEVVRVFKAVSAKEIRSEYPGVRKELWGGEFWEDGYFVRTVGEKVPTEIIRKYFRFHEERKTHPEQLDLF